MAGVFNNAVLTQKGLALMAKAQAELCTIHFTRGVSGDGSYTPGEIITTRTALKSQKQSVSLISASVYNSDNVFIKFELSNYTSATEYLTTGYYLKEIGLYATDPDEGEILYCIATAVQNQWDYMPAYNGVYPTKIRINLLAQAANASSVTITALVQQTLIDEVTGTEYALGINNGRLFWEEAD